MGINTNLPGAFQGQELDAEKAYQDALTGIAGRTAQYAHDTGFTYQQGDDGKVNNVAIDPMNQFSQVMGLLGSHADQFKSMRENLVGKNLGTTGLAGKRAALARFIAQGETSGLGANFSKGLSSLFNERSQALNTRNSAFTSAEQAALLYALQQQQFNVAKTPDDTSGTGATGKVGTKDAAGNVYAAPPSIPAGTRVGAQSVISEHGQGGGYATPAMQNPTVGIPTFLPGGAPTATARSTLVKTASKVVNSQASRNSY